MSVTQQLIDMGFPAERASAAAGDNRNLGQALDWIQGESEPVLDVVAPGAESSSGSSGEGSDETDIPLVAASYKCDDCGKLLANDDAVWYHASKTKHGNFSQSTEKVKELTREEKEEQVRQVIEKIKQAQEKKAQVETVEAREKEQKRREDGKAMISHREAARDREIKEAAEMRRRQKIEDEEAKKKVLEQIRLDREERKAKASGVPIAPKPAAVVNVVAPPKDYSTTTLQIRLLDGKTVRQQFKADEPLVMVRAWIETNNPVGSVFSLMTPFPKKEFVEDDMGTKLKDLNLVPSANIVVLNRLV